MWKRFSQICFTFAGVAGRHCPAAAKAQVCYDKSTYLKTIYFMDSQVHSNLWGPVPDLIKI